jgi:hypothetical protein
MSARSLLMSAAGNAGEKLYVDDVFSAWPYTGNSSTQNIVNGIDLAGKGGMTVIKHRTAAYSHYSANTVDGGGKHLRTDNTDAISTDAGNLSAFTLNGFTVGSNGGVNTAANSYISWTFRNAYNFFQVLSVTKSAGSNLVIDLSPYMTTPGMVKVKRTDAAGSWYVWHRSLTAGQLLIGESTAAAATLGQITVVGTTLTLVNGVIADGTYHVEAYAHDTSADGLIRCGSYAGTGASGNIVALDWEQQYLYIKKISGVAPDIIVDASRGFCASAASNKIIRPSTSAAEFTDGGGREVYPQASGFSPIGSDSEVNQTGQTYIYLAIRRPNKPPTTGTQVYACDSRNSNGAGVAPGYRSGFPVDLVISRLRTPAGFNNNVNSRLTGSGNLATDTTGAEGTSSSAKFDYMHGFSDSVSTNSDLFAWMFRRAPGVHDQICYGGTASNKTEVIPVLGVPAELWLIKGCSGATQWVWGSSLLASTEKIVMPSPNGRVTDATAWNSTYPTASALSLGTAAAVNTAAATYVAYLWATLAGISKVFGYAGNGSTQLINCGFTTGARFVMVLRTTAGTSQDIFIWDTARGIVAGNDPHLSLNSTAAEVTTDDSIDPDASGFIVNQLAATNINVNGATYIGLAYA